MRSFQAAGFQPVRPQNRTNNFENICGLDDMDDEENTDELGESGGMRARPESRKPSTQEVEAHGIDHCSFRSWCRYCGMAASRSDHHRRQAEDYNEVPVISCDHGFLTDSRDDDERQLAVAEAIAAAATPILVIREKRSNVIHADSVRCETTTKWILGVGYPEVTIRTDGESSIVALSRRVGEKLREASVKQCTAQASLRQQISRTRRE